MQMALQAGSSQAFRAPLTPESPEGIGGQGKRERAVWEKQISVPSTQCATRMGESWSIWRNEQLCWLRVRTGWHLWQKCFPEWHVAVVSQHAAALLCSSRLSLLPLQHWVLAAADRWGRFPAMAKMSYVPLPLSLIHHTHFSSGCSSPTLKFPWSLSAPKKVSCFWEQVSGHNQSHRQLQLWSCGTGAMG